MRFLDLNQDLVKQFNEAADNGNYKRGDIPSDKINKTGHFELVLIVNDDNFLDCEYLLKLDNKIYTREEANNLASILK